jgi:hypothetical protein
MLLFPYVIFGNDSPSEDKWIRKGRIFYEIGLGQEQVINPTKKDNDYSNYYFRYLPNTNSSYQLLGITGIIDSQKQIDTTGNNQKISLEYLLNDWISIGGSLQNSIISTYHLTKNDTELSNPFYDPVQLLAVFVPELQNTSDAFNIYGLLPEKKQLQYIRTYDYDLTFHLPTGGNIDPYFRISAGRGFMTADLIGRTGWATGIKWKIDSKLYLNTDIYQSRIISRSSNGDVDHFLETGLRLGIGIYSTWPN